MYAYFLTYIRKISKSVIIASLASISIISIISVIVLQDYVPHLRSNPSVNSLPSPPDMPTRYNAALRFFCDVSLSPQQMHDLGQEKVTSLIQQIREVRI